MMYSLKDKKHDEEVGAVIYSNLDRASVLQEARLFHETPLHPKKCISILTKIISLIMRGEKLGRTEATDTFFAMTKLFQNNDVNLRRMVYLCIKEMSTLSDDVIIVTSSLTKDMNGRETSFRAPAIRALCKITDGTMVQAIERYMKQAIVDKNANISSAALVSSMHLMRTTPEVVKRWSNEVQEAANSDGQMPQYHGVGLLYQMRKTDKLAINKMVQKYSKRGFRSAHAQLFLVKMAARVIDEEGLGHDHPLFDFLESSLRHKSEMVIYEAARAIVNLPNTTAKELGAAISVLQLFCASPKPVLRYAAVRTLNLVSLRHPAAVTACNLDLEQMITDSNRHIATLAITTLLKTGTENSVERLLKQIATFMHEITDESKFQVVYALQDLVTRYHRKHSAIVEFLAKTFRDNSSDDLKKRILNVLEVVQRDIPSSRPSVYSHVCEFMEDLDNQTLSTRILTMLGNEGPKMPNASNFVRFIYNRTLIDLSVVRSCAVSTLAKFAAYCDELYDRIMVLLSRLRLDDEDEVRDRATFFYTLLLDKNKSKSLFYAFNDNKYDPAGLERCLYDYYHDNSQHEKPFDVSTVPLRSVQPEKDAIARDIAAVTGTSTTRAQGGAKPAAGGGPMAGGDRKTREELCHEALITAAPDSGPTLGNLFKASEAINLTEAETEYVVRCTKLLYTKHVVLQYDVLNTLNDQLLENVHVEAMVDDEDFELERVIPCETIPYNKTGTTYSIYRLPEARAQSKAGFECCLKFLVKDCDPESGEPDEMDGYPEEYELESFELTWADNFQKVRRANFSAAWEEIGSDNQLEETYALHTENIPETVKAVVEHLGMQPCESSDKMVEGKSTHNLYLSGVFRGGVDVLIVAKLVLNPGGAGVSMQMQLRSTDAEISAVIADAIS